MSHGPLEVCSVDIWVAWVRIGTDFIGILQADTSMRALWSDRQDCSHNVSQTFKRVRLFLINSETSNER